MQKRYAYWCTITALVLGAAAGQCFAKSDPSGSLSLETITVTADKRKENIQKVPSAITGFTQSHLEDAGIKDIEDLVRFVPNMSFGSSMQGAQEINFRGIGLSQFTGKNPVVIFMDGVAQDHDTSYEVDLTNVERVEVLRGSQGTLYGKNAIGGVINIISKAPGNNFNAGATGTIGENGTYGLSTYANGPLVKDHLFFGISANHHETDGYMENDHPDGGTSDHEEGLSFKSRLRWLPLDRLEVNLHGGVSRDRDGSGVQVAANSGNQAYHAYKNPDDRSDTDRALAALNIKYAGEKFKATAITTYSRDTIEVFQDQTYINSSRPIALNDSENRIFSQELRLQSPDHKKGFQWLAGLYYARDELSYTDNAMKYDTTAWSGYDVKYNWADDTGENTMAAFGQVTIPLPARLAFTAGLRYEQVDKEMDYRYRVTRTDTGAVLPQDPFMPGNPPTQVTYFVEDDWDAVLPKGVLSWEINDSAMVYAGVTKGYLAGGFNLCENIRDRAKFDEQSTIDYSLGAKTAWFDNRLIVNANLFYMDIKDMHVYYAPDPVTYITSNAGEAHSRGIEIEVTARPVRGLDLMAGFGLTDAEYDRYVNTAGKDCTGKTLERTPAYTLNLAAQYRHTSGFYARMEMQAFGESYFDERNTTGQDAYEIYNAKIGYEAERWDIYIYGKNLMDEEYFSFGRVNATGVMANMGAPRTVGVTASIRF